MLTDGDLIYALYRNIRLLFYIQINSVNELLLSDSLTLYFVQLIYPF